MSIQTDCEIKTIDQTSLSRTRKKTVYSVIWLHLLSNYKDLKIEIERMWGMRANYSSGDRYLGTDKERDGQVHPIDSW